MAYDIVYCVITYSPSSLGITAALFCKDAQARASATAHASAVNMGFLYIDNCNVEGFDPDDLLRATKCYGSSRCLWRSG